MSERRGAGRCCCGCCDVLETPRLPVTIVISMHLRDRRGVLIIMSGWLAPRGREAGGTSRRALSSGALLLVLAVAPLAPSDALLLRYSPVVRPQLRHQPAFRPHERARSPVMGNPVPFSTRAYLKKTQRDERTLMGKWVAAGLPQWVTLLDEILFLTASVIFLIGSFYFYPGVPFEQYVLGCQLFIIGSMIFLILALFASYEIVTDARLSAKPPEASELAEQFLYLVGSALFLVGTVLFTPPLEQAAVDAASAAADAAQGAQVISVRFFGQMYDIIVQQNEVPSPDLTCLT